MPRDENTISTSVDRLLSYLDEEGETSIETIVDDLGVSEQQVKAWVKALEASDMIAKNYTAREGTLISLKQDDVEAHAETVSSETGDQIDALTETIEHIDDLDEATATLKELSKTFKESIEAQEEMKDLLHELHEEDAEIEDALTELSGEERELEGEALHTLEDIEQTIEDEHPDETVDAFKTEKEAVEHRLETLQGLKNHIETIEANEQAKKECDICGATFETQHGLRTHKGMKHPDHETTEQNGLLARIKSFFS